MNLQELDLTFTVTGSEAELIGEALAKLPYERVVNIINRLQASINVQIAQAQAAEAAKMGSEAGSNDNQPAQ